MGCIMSSTSCHISLQEKILKRKQLGRWKKARLKTGTKMSLKTSLATCHLMSFQRSTDSNHAGCILSTHRQRGLWT